MKQKTKQHLAKILTARFAKIEQDKTVNIQQDNVWKFKKDCPDVWQKAGDVIIEQINLVGKCLIQAGKKDYVKLTY